jgi:hypothetical protein
MTLVQVVKALAFAALVLFVAFAIAYAVVLLAIVYLGGPGGVD